MPLKLLEGLFHTSETAFAQKPTFSLALKKKIQQFL